MAEPFTAAEVQEKCGQLVVLAQRRLAEGHSYERVLDVTLECLDNIATATEA